MKKNSNTNLILGILSIMVITGFAYHFASKGVRTRLGAGPFYTEIN